MFSIVMYNYNKAPYIETAIRSVFAQTYTDWELLIIDDCSTDESIAIADRVVMERCMELHGARGWPPYIRGFGHDENGGVSICHIRGFTQARGGLIGILDSDDALEPNALERMVAFANDNPRAGLLYSQYLHCDINLVPLNLGPNHLPTGSIIDDKDAVSHFKVFRREEYQLTAGFDAKFTKAADRDITLKMEEVAPLAFLDEPLYRYRYTGDGISQGSNGRAALAMWNQAVADARGRRVKVQLDRTQSMVYAQNKIRKERRAEK